MNTKDSAVDVTATKDRPAAAAYAVNHDLPRRLRSLLSLDDFEIAARKILPHPIFAYIAGAAEDNKSMMGNRTAFDTVRFQPRVLVDVSKRAQAVEIFGRRYDSPIGIAPVGVSAIAAYQGDIVLAEAATAENIPAIMSGSSLIKMETVHSAAPNTWFQAYLPGNEAKRDALVERISATGFETLVVTVDIPVWANRENNVRAGFSLPLRPSVKLAWAGATRPRWLLQTFLRTLITTGMPHFENSFATRGAPILSASALRDTTGRDHLSWSEIERIRRQWKGNLVLKGLLHPEDAKKAVSIGADGIIVSNHGGRQLDGALEPFLALPRICDEVGHKTVVMMDGGVRRGSDVLKALAHGAQLVFLGRPFIYAAAVGGKAGVSHAISLLRDEIDRNMAMLGTTSLDEVVRDVLA